MSDSLQLRVLESSFTVHRLPVSASLPQTVLNSQLFSVMRTEDELSIVCESSITVDSEQAETDWSALKVEGTLDFSLTGILARLATVLADAQVSIFALSTYDTDYILVKYDKLEQACSALTQAGYEVVIPIK